jgi:hypothetical protein
MWDLEGLDRGTALRYPNQGVLVHRRGVGEISYLATARVGRVEAAGADGPHRFRAARRPGSG